MSNNRITQAIAAAALTAITAHTVPASTPDTVVISPSRTIVAPFHGLGVQWDPFAYPPTETEGHTILERMDYCRPGYLRVMHNLPDYLTGFDAAGKPQFVWETHDPEKRKNFDQLINILDYAQSRHIDVILGLWGPPPQRLIEGGQSDPKWTQVIGDFLVYLRKERGYTCIRYYNIINEPNGNWSGNKDFPTWVTTVDNLHKELIARGLDQDIAIVGPDASVSSKWKESLDWLDWTVRDASKQVGVWDLHWYAEDPEVLDGTLEKILVEKRQVIEASGPENAAKPRLMCESGIFTGRTNGDQQPRVKTFEYGVLMSDYVAQVARAGWQGALAWDLDDAMHFVSGKHRPDPPDDLTLKIWGFWNTQGPRMGHPEDLRMRPWFYTWSTMSRLFPKGSRIVETITPDLPHFRVMAASVPHGHKDSLSIMLVNDEDSPRTVLVKTDEAHDSATVDRYDYFDQNRPVDAHGFATPARVIKHADLAKGIEIDLPTRGVVILNAH
jgi:hypothetical protein